MLDVMLGATLAGIVGRFVCHPLDTCKSMMQSGRYDAALQDSTFTTMQHIVKTEGMRGLYKGLGPSLLGGIPGVSIYLSSYEYFKIRLGAISFLPSSLVHLFSGIIAETLSCVVFVPVDVVKERLQVQQSRIPLTSSCGVVTEGVQYRDAIHVINHLYGKYGVAGIYRGYSATVLSYAPFSALYFLLYEQVKSLVVSLSGEANRDIGFYESMASAAGAGAVASYITSPLDMAKLRLQVVDQGFGPQKNSQSETGGFKVGGARGLYSVLCSVYAAEGTRGLFKGAGARVLFHTPNTAITMALFEKCRVYSKQLLEYVGGPNDKI